MAGQSPCMTELDVVANRLRGRVAIVTGGGQGIGAAIAQQFTRAGAAVAIAELNHERGEAVANTIRQLQGADCVALQTDVTSPDSVAEMLDQVVDLIGIPDILVNNAGIAAFSDPLQLTPQKWRECFAVDLDAVWTCARAVLPLMLKIGRGSIVNIASVHSFKIIPGTFPYPVAKHGVIGLTRALAIEYARQQIRINAICPGYIETEITQQYWQTFDDPEAERARVNAIHPVGRIGRPDEVAAAALFLASEEASFITGASLIVDGGRSILYHD